MKTIRFGGKEYLTTGQAAKLLGCATRTVAKWYEAGRLTGYRLPMSHDRRISVDGIFEMARRENLPYEDLLAGLGFVVAVLTESEPVFALASAVERTERERLFSHCRTAFELADLLARCRDPEELWLDLRVGRAQALEAARHVRSGRPHTRLYLLVEEDEAERETLAGLGTVLDRERFLRGGCVREEKRDD